MTVTGYCSFYKKLDSVYSYRGFLIKVYLSRIDAYDAETFDSKSNYFHWTQGHSTQWQCVMRAFYNIDVYLCDDNDQAELDKYVDDFV